MATTTRSIHTIGDMGAPDFSSCPVSRGMLLSAFSENVAITLDVILRAVAGGLLFWLLGYGLPVTPGLSFFAALSASLGVLYLANLADVNNVRDGIISTVSAFLVWGILAFDANNAALVGLTLFAHLMVAFFAGFARVSGSLRDMALWPVLFGGLSITLVGFVDLFLI
ncbi:MAG: hypothetical protein VYA55_11650 [Pseudomonadota bacterium]|nr:hypothetical protein [Pseudomonadota bacterium]